MSDSQISIATAESETAEPSQPSPGDLRGRGNINWRKSNVILSWYYLNAVGLVLFAVAFASSLCNVVYSSWVTGNRCSEARLRNDTAEEDSSITVHLWSFCNVHLVDDGESVIRYSNCSTWDAEMMPVWYHGVQLATVVNMLSITVCMALAGFSWFCCRRNQRHVFISVCLSAVCSVVAQLIGLCFFSTGDVTSLFDRLTDAVDGTSCANYRFSGYGSALVLSVMSLMASVVATLLQAPISWMRSILSASRLYNRFTSQSSDERTPLIQETIPPQIQSAENGA